MTAMNSLYLVVPLAPLVAAVVVGLFGPKLGRASDQQQQPAPRVVVVLVHLEVLGEVRDALGQHRDLGLRRTGIGLVQAVLAQDFFLLLGSERHEINSIKSVRDHPGCSPAGAAAANCSTRRVVRRV